MSLFDISTANTEAAKADAARFSAIARARRAPTGYKTEALVRAKDATTDALRAEVAAYKAAQHG